MRFDTLDQVVKDICEIGGGDMQHKNYGTVLKICVRALQDLNLFTQIPNYKTVELEVRGNLTAKMPDDVLRPLKIGKLENGRIFEIRYAQDIVIPKNALTECCECEEEVKVYETVVAGSEGGGTGLCDYTITLAEQQCCDYSVEGIELRNGICLTFPEIIAVQTGGNNSEVSVSISYKGIVYELFYIKYPLTGNYTINNIYDQFDLEQLDGIIDYTLINNVLCFEDFDEDLFIAFGDTTNNITNFNEVSISTINTYNITGSGTFGFSAQIIPNLFQVLINSTWTDVTDEVENGTWTRTNVCDDVITEWRIIDSEENVVDSGNVTATCEDINPLENKKLYVLINNEWVDVTDEVVGNTWTRLQTSDIIGAYRVQDLDSPTGNCCVFTASGNLEEFTEETPLQVLVNGVWQTVPSEEIVDGTWTRQSCEDTITEWKIESVTGGSIASRTFTFTNLPLNFQDLSSFGYIYGISNFNKGFFWRNDIIASQYGNISQLKLHDTLEECAQEFADWFNWFVSQNPTSDPSGAVLSATVSGAQVTIQTDIPTAYFIAPSIGFRLFDEYQWFGNSQTLYFLTGGTAPVITLIDSGEVTAVCEPVYVEEGFATADCDEPPIPPVSYQRLKSIEKVKPKCDSKGCCNSCRKPQRNNNVLSQQNYPDARLIPDVIFGGNLAANIDAFFNYNNIRSSQYYVERFGQQPNPPKLGWFNYDLVNGIIKLDGNWSEGDCLLFMYRTEMQELDGTKVIPVECFNMLLYKCKEMLWTRNRPDQMNQRQLFEDEYKRIKRIYNKMTIQEWEDAISGYKYSSAKR